MIPDRPSPVLAQLCGCVDRGGVGRSVAMFAITFLGHQGWVFSSERACIAIDPLLREEFGHLHALGYQVFPPRQFTFDKFPRLDAVLLSHEHDDHFDIPSLAMLDRAIPIHLSARSSSAGFRILREMGFSVTPLEPGVALGFGDLEVVPCTGDQLNSYCGDEWDTLPYLVRHADGNFFTMVDIPIMVGHAEWARKQVAKPGLIGWTNNALDWSHMADFLTERTEGTQQCFMKMGIGRKLLADYWGVPAAMVMCAGGFSFVGDRAWLNEQVFCVDNEAVCNLMAVVHKKEKFIAGTPGQTFVMEGGKLKRIDRTPWLTTLPPEQWPSRAKRQLPPQLPDYDPATGARALIEGELAELAVALDELALTMVGGRLFKSLLSLHHDDAAGRIASFVFVVRDGERRHAFAYEPQDCRFVAVDGDVRARYLAGLECWGPDLLAVVRGRLGPIALTFGRARAWNAAPKRLRFSIFDELYGLSHPLSRPAVTFDVYQRQWQQHATTVPRIAHRP